MFIITMRIKAKLFYCFLIGFASLILPNTVSAQVNCNNVDFESGTFANWTGYTGVCCPITADTVGFVSTRHTIMTGAGNDPVIPQIPVVSPYGGTYSVRLGNSSIGAQAERLTYTLNVTAANPNFTYQYAVILEDPSHTPAQQPRFQVNVMDTDGATIPCGFYNVVASGNIPGFQRTGSIVWKNWSFVAVDLSSYIGQNITVEFSTGDCDLGGHYGYAYIDASCAPLRIFTNYCPGDPIADLTAPPGFQFYQWSTGESAQAITVTNPVPGDSITVVCVPFQGVTCTSTLKYIFLQNPPVEANYSINTVCGNNQVVFSDSSTISATGAQVTGWKWIINDSIISTQPAATFSFPAAGSYDVTLIAESSYGCPDTLHKQVLIPQGLLVTANIRSGSGGFALQCIGDNNAVLKANANLGIPPYSYQWNTIPVSTGDSISNLSAGTYTVSVTDSTGCIATASAVISAPPPAVMDPVIKNVSCYNGNNGQITALMSGGTPPYTYSWNTNPPQSFQTISNLGAGSYTVTITDNNQCTTLVSSVVSEPSQLNISITSKTDNVCFGGHTGRATASASGGNAPYIYSWNTNPIQNDTAASNLSAGNYVVTATDDSLCTATTTVVINEPTKLSSTSTVDNVLCHDSAQGSIALIVSNGTAPYTYSWQPSVSTTAAAQNLKMGTYDVTITDNNGCTLSNSFIVIEPPALNIQTQSTNVLCSGNLDGTITATGVGGIPTYTYSLLQNGNTISTNTTGSFTGLGVGNYTIIFSDGNNCAVSQQLTVNEPPLISIQSIVADSVNCYGYNDGAISIVATGGVPPFEYVLNNNAPSSSGNFNNLPPGNYSITINDAGGCSLQTATNINEPPPHILSIIPDSIQMNLGESRAVQIISNFAPNVIYSWSPESGTDCPTCPNANVGTYNSLEYSIRAVAHPHQLDCEATIKLPVTVTANYDIFIPNVFTPNNDGVNDFFEYFGNKSGVKYLDVEVFNRTGEKVFESNDINFRWDGKFKGVVQNPGVYVYQFKVIFVDGYTEKLYKGSVTILR
ncbi:MAG: gliding motility-associated C-terminal domain-containing protein [Bacteroidetes bacterium]|nr:gliding motility-associated C-terminal domain-containing protein [Bacteroidota bacterium]